MSDNIDIIIEQQTSPVIEIPPQGTDGIGIASIELISTVGLVKTYRINYTNGNHFDFEVTDGSDANCVWGNITGILADQTDLKNALDAKADASQVYTKDDADALLDAKADADSVYTKTEADALLDEKADASSVYTKTETDDLLDLKADKADVYTQAELDGIFDGIDNALDTKADVSDVYTKTQTDNLLADKADADDVYTKAEADTLLSGKADKTDTYTEAEVDALLTVKADADDVYTKAEADALLGDKADADDVYTKTETDNLLNAKANSADLGALASKDTVDYDTEVTNKPTLGTMAAEDTGDYYTKTETDTLLSAKANSADLGTMSAEDASDYYDKSATDALLQDKADIILSSASGSIASFSDGADYPVTALSVGIEPVQDLHGYANPWPAGGGKNLHKPYSYSIHIENVDVTYSTDGSVTLNGGVVSVTSGTPSVSTAVQNGYTYTLPAGTYIASMSGSTSNVGLDVYNTSTVTRLAGANEAFTLSASTTILVRISILSGKSYSNQKLYLQLESGSTATSYAPYSNICPISGHTEMNLYHEAEYDADADPKVTIDLGGTRYGGTVNVLTGEMVVDRVLLADLGTITDWTYESTSGHERFYSNAIKTAVKLPESSSNKADLICSEYNTITANQTYTHSNGYGIGVNVQGVIYIYDGRYTDAQTFTTAMSGVQLVYALATPLTVQLSPSTLSTLLGDNNIWSSTGQTSVTYRADTKMFIEGQIAESQRATRSLIAGIETEMVATKNYVIGNLLIVGDTLYTVTANIGSGSAITVGTNVAVTTVAAQLIALANA